VVLVDEAAEAVAAVDPARLRLFWRLMRVGGTKFKATMRPLAVVVVRIDTEHLFAVGRLRINSQSRHSARTVRTKRSAIAFAFGARTGVFTNRVPSLRKT